jgi:hypothetical protein
VPAAALESRRRAVVLALHAVALEGRVESLTTQLAALQSRLSAVETTLLEAAWAEPAAVAEPVAGDVDAERAVVVPKLALDDVRMSSTAARALFGG